MRRNKNRKNSSILKFFLLAFVLILLIVISTLTIFVMDLNNAEDEFQEMASDVHDIVLESIETPMPTVSHAPLTTEDETPVLPTPSAAEILPQYVMIYNKNPDLFGWLTIEGTQIDYPIMHTPSEPDKYLHTDFNGEYSYPGVPYLEEECSAKSDNLIIYGHNMKNGTMFRGLFDYEDESFYQNNPLIHFNTLYEEAEYEIIAVFYDRVYKKSDTCFKFYKFINAKDEADFNHAIAQFKEKSLYDTGVTASYGDQLLTLVTCSYHVDNGRFVVVAKKK